MLKCPGTILVPAPRHTRSTAEGWRMRVLCHVPPLLWFQADPVYSRPPGGGVLIRTQTPSPPPAGSFPEFPGFSISCQQNHNGSFPFHDPRALKTRTLPAHKRAKRWRRCLTWLPSSSTVSKTAWMQRMVIGRTHIVVSSHLHRMEYKQEQTFVRHARWHLQQWE